MKQHTLIAVTIFFISMVACQSLRSSNNLESEKNQRKLAMHEEADIHVHPEWLYRENRNTGSISFAGRMGGGTGGALAGLGAAILIPEPVSTAGGIMALLGTLALSGGGFLGGLTGGDAVGTEVESHLRQPLKRVCVSVLLLKRLEKRGQLPEVIKEAKKWRLVSDNQVYNIVGEHHDLLLPQYNDFISNCPSEGELLKYCKGIIRKSGDGGENDTAKVCRAYFPKSDLPNFRYNINTRRE